MPGMRLRAPMVPSVAVVSCSVAAESSVISVGGTVVGIVVGMVVGMVVGTVVGAMVAPVVGGSSVGAALDLRQPARSVSVRTSMAAKIPYFFTFI